jgi:hypothetical protein
MTTETERMRILQMIEDGKISAAEGLRLLDALGAPPVADAPPDPAGASAAGGAPPDPNLDRWRRWWIVPMWVGTGVVLVSALLMYAAYQGSGFGFWFACATLPFLAGVAVMALAGFSQSARWVHIRVQRSQGDGPRNIAISLPLPIKLTAWALRTFGHRIPQLNQTGVDELVLALAEHTSAKTPFYVDVDGGRDGEHVQVYIG